MTARGHDGPEVDGIHAVLVAVESLDEAACRFQSILGGELLAAERIDQGQMTRQLLRLASGAHIQLMEPLPGENPLRDFLERQGEGLYGIAFGVHDLERAAGAVEDMPDTRAAGPIVELSGMRELVLHPSGTHGVLTVYREADLAST